MAQPATPTAHFSFAVDSIGLSGGWESLNNVWRPPRALGSNILLPSPAGGIWFEYNHGNIQEHRQRPQVTSELFRTFSFYCHDNVIWVYPDDATRRKVGDGSGHRRRDAAESSSESDETDSASDADDRPLQDWRPLSFRHTPTYSSYATWDGWQGAQRTMKVVRQDQGALRELIPRRYFPNAQAIPAAQSHVGGLMGDLPILIALVAFSVGPGQVRATLRNSFQRCYVAHGGPPTANWHYERGIRVQVYCRGAHTVPQGVALPRRVLQEFEEGRLHGYGKFVR